MAVIQLVECGVKLTEKGEIVRLLKGLPEKELKDTSKVIIENKTVSSKESFVVSTTKKAVEKAVEKVYKVEKNEMAVYKITPTPSIRNNQAYLIAKIISGFYEKPSTLKKYLKNGSLLTEREQYRCNFRIMFKPNDISFHFILPVEKANEILRKVESVYDNGITVEKIEIELPKLDPKKTFCTHLEYKNPSIFSLDTNKGNNYPLPSLLTTVRTLEENDIAIMDIMLEPHCPDSWTKEAKDGHQLLNQGFVPKGNLRNKLLRGVQQGYIYGSYKLLEFTRMSKESMLELEEHKKNDPIFLEAQRLKRDITPTTTKKTEVPVLNTWLRVAVQSDSSLRAKDIAHTIANSWKDISGDNEIMHKDVPKQHVERYVNAIENRSKIISKRLFYLYGSHKLSVDEVGKFIQLPGESLIKEFSELNARLNKEVSLPEELTRKDIKHIRLGYVTERGNKKLARFPLEAYDDISQDAVYDALCTPSVAQGKVGSGKTGQGKSTAYDMMQAGFSTILIDTADGESLREYINSLPADYPEEKIHVLNFDNKAYPIPLNWSDVLGRELKVDDDAELEYLEISERMTTRSIDFVNSLSNTGEFSDRMRQYLSSCMRAVTKTRHWSFLDVELALSSPAYREELLALKEVQEELDVVRDLESLQAKAKNNKQGEIIDNIVNRLSVLSSTTFLSNLYMQPPKLTDEGKPALDLRKIMDNEEGGYGHTVAIFASSLWESNQSIILGFMEDRINFNAYSRIDIPQSQRKPVLKWIDEPHKVIRHIEGRLAGTNVEFRKYRVKNMFTVHSLDQMGKAANSLLEGGLQISSYKTENEKNLEAFKHMFAPYDDMRQLYAALPEKHVAINKVRLPSGKNCPAFLAQMVEPPKFVKDRSQVWHDSAKKYGRPWKEVKNDIQDKRVEYRELDAIWMEENAPVKAPKAK